MKRERKREVKKTSLGESSCLGEIYLLSLPCFSFPELQFLSVSEQCMG